ncbi:hypothetical protein QBC36DRAFT_316656 [Triangularia setosa]|uniref:RING-type domain-containing protein n=1 Tax=Triangularia setosa TaxID=2587417 RepID=A0AAN7ACU9_9PEZI|nr:hypothetical protein QBC36DRAFT_316656 [Podospora setosa]
MSVSSASMDLESDDWSDSESDNWVPYSDTPYSPSSRPQLPDYESDLPDYESDTDTIQVIDDVSDLEQGGIREDDDLEVGEIREVLEQGENREEETHNMGSYVPDPKYTFLFDPDRHNHKHTCSICMTSDLRILPGEPRPDGQFTYDTTNDSVPCVLPCGHMFGQDCIRQWMENHDQCPVCRTPMVHELCRHQVRLRPMWRDLMWLIPRTLPDGGKIAPFCRHCEAAERQSVINGLMVTLARLYYDAKIRWKKTGRERDRVEMMKFRVRMDADVQRLAVKETVGEW